MSGYECFYWTRSPDSGYGSHVRSIGFRGDFYYYDSAYDGSAGVRPALNLKSDIRVSEVKK